MLHTKGNVLVNGSKAGVKGAVFAGDALQILVQRVGPGRIGIPECPGFWDPFVRELRAMSGIRFPGTMRRLVMEAKKERLVFRTALEEVEAEIRNYVGGIPLDHPAAVPVQERGIVIQSLAGQHDVMIEPSRLGAEMPFTHDAGVITRGLEMLGDVRL